MHPDMENVIHVPEASVFSGVVQPALWLGFSEIFLLGCDFSYTYHDDEYRNGHSEKYTSRAINEVMAEVGRLYPEALVAAVDCDREARPVLHEKYPLDLDYITAAEALGVDSGDAVHAP
jgi:hypothetical protein